MRRGKGHIPDLPDARDERFGLTPLIAAAGDPPLTSVPTAVDWSMMVDTIWDQGQTESCVGHAMARAIHLRAMIAGRPIVKPSPLALYTMARLRGDSGLADSGCVPRDAAESMRAFGIVAEYRWPLTAENMVAMLPWDVMQAGADAHVTGYSRLLSFGPNLADEIREALAAGFPVPFAMIVDSAYEDLDTGNVYKGISGTPAGGHYQCLVGYRSGAFKCVNSWGAYWGERGCAWLDEDWVTSEYCSDFYAIEASPGAIE